jgi:hypothetical protein
MGGQLMDDREMDLFTTIKGLKKVDPSQLVEFQKSMLEKVIPEIVRNVEDRQTISAEKRFTILK